LAHAPVFKRRRGSCRVPGFHRGKRVRDRRRSEGTGTRRREHPLFVGAVPVYLIRDEMRCGLAVSVPSYEGHFDAGYCISPDGRRAAIRRSGARVAESRNYTWTADTFRMIEVGPELVEGPSTTRWAGPSSARTDRRLAYVAAQVSWAVKATRTVEKRTARSAIVLDGEEKWWKAVEYAGRSSARMGPGWPG